MAYIPIILPADLSDVLYQEIIDEISRNDSIKIGRAIDTAIQEAKMYLTRYDLIKLFGDKPDNGGLDVAASFTDSFLIRMIEDIAIWHLLQLANPNVSYDAAKARYDSAIDSLKRIQKGIADPKWPYQDNTNEADTVPDSDQVTIQSNPLRSNYY